MDYETIIAHYCRLYPKEVIWMEQTDPIQAPSIIYDYTPSDKANVLLHYGIGGGEAFDAFKPWLEKDPTRLLVFVESELSVLKNYFEKGGEALFHPQVEVHPLNQGVYHRLMWLVADKPFEVIKDPRYPQEPFKVFQEKMLYNGQRVKSFYDEYLACGDLYYRNFYKNLHQWPYSLDGSALVGAFKKVPAIIAGAGPSLTKHGALLKALKSKALLLTGGSGLNALLHLGVTPHFTAGIDPNPDQVRRVTEAKENVVPFLYRLRLHPEALAAVKGDKIYVGGSSSYPTASCLERLLGLQEVAVDEGHNVINFVTSLALLMRCDPIVFVGMDLSYTGGMPYAAGVDPFYCNDEEVIDWPDIDGKLTKTRWVWVQESRFLQGVQGAQFFNATGAGIGLAGVPSVALEKVTEGWKRRSLAFSLPQLPVKPQALAAVLDDLKASVKRVIQHIETLLVIDPLDSRVQWIEHELEHEIAFEAVFSVFDEVYRQVFEASHAQYRRQLLGQEGQVVSKERLKFLHRVGQYQLECLAVS